MRWRLCIVWFSFSFFFPRNQHLKMPVCVCLSLIVSSLMMKILWKSKLFELYVMLLYSLRRRANARNISFQISLQWPIHIINPVDKTKLSCYTPHWRSTTVSLETYPFYLFVWVLSGHLDIFHFLQNIFTLRWTETTLRE